MNSKNGIERQIITAKQKTRSYARNSKNGIESLGLGRNRELEFLEHRIPRMELKASAHRSR